MHLAIDAEQRAIGVDDRRGVVVEAGGALLEQRGDDHHAEFGGQRAQAVGGGAGDGFGEIEQAGVFFAAEILRAEQFLQADDLRALLRGFADLARRLGRDSPAGSRPQAIWTSPMRNFSGVTGTILRRSIFRSERY